MGQHHQEPGGNVLVAYSHEPEISSKTWMGSSTDFKAAYAKFVNIFRGQGATNVKFVLQLTAWSYRSGSSDPSNVAKWYPGDAYVDVLGADAYNWSNCGVGKGKWVELQTLVDPVLTFAKSHSKMVALPEYGATADSRRAQWMSQRAVVPDRQRVLDRGRLLLQPSADQPQEPELQVDADHQRRVRRARCVAA